MGNDFCEIIGCQYRDSRYLYKGNYCSAKGHRDNGMICMYMHNRKPVLDYEFEHEENYRSPLKIIAAWVKYKNSKI